MSITYRNTIEGLNPANLRDLFTSVNYASSLTADELFSAISESTHVVVAWDGEIPVGFTRSMDDYIYSANIDLLLVRPDYQGRGIAKGLLGQLMADIGEIKYISVSPNERLNCPLYAGYGFKEVIGACLMQKVADSEI